jgi:predicted GIY-YIG superfamily endonuclease
MSGNQYHGGHGGGPGTVYLIHLDTPYRHARHYTGWTTDLDARLEAHRDGRGARLMEVIKAAGISWRLARTWPGGRDRERAIKDRHEAPKLCPECSTQPRPVRAGRSAGQERSVPQAAAAGQPRNGLERETPATSPDDDWLQVRPPEADLGDAELEAG